jgi:hypothetical protein
MGKTTENMLYESGVPRRNYDSHVPLTLCCG